VDETSVETLKIISPVQTESPAEDISSNDEEAMAVDSADDEDKDAMVVDIVANAQSDAAIGLNEGIGFFKNGENLRSYPSRHNIKFYTAHNTTSITGGTFAGVYGLRHCCLRRLSSL
jgi:hypothetical protein